MTIVEATTDLVAGEQLAEGAPPQPPRVIAFSGDDTLWHSETLFSMTQGRFGTLLTRHVDLPREVVDARLSETVQRNLLIYGYGIKGFVLSMVETAIEVTQSRIPVEDIRAILEFGRTLLEHPVELIEGAREVLETLRARDYELWLVAEGDLFDQEGKLARSGLGPLLHRVEVVSRKDEPSYQRLLGRYGVLPEEFVMVGPSVHSDVLPVLAIGARAFHVPYGVSWAKELGSVPEAERARIVTLDRLSDLLERLGPTTRPA